ncbi:MAG: hypothetical protein V3U49_01635 [Nitrososphaerales archaeon]
MGSRYDNVWSSDRLKEEIRQSKRLENLFGVGAAILFTIALSSLTYGISFAKISLFPPIYWVLSTLLLVVGVRLTFLAISNNRAYENLKSKL